MKKSSLLLSLIFVFLLKTFLFADEIPHFEDFPIYPYPIISSKKNDNITEFKLDLLSSELRKKIEFKCDIGLSYKLRRKYDDKQKSAYKIANQKISFANTYLYDNALQNGWITAVKAIYSDGGSNLYIFEKKFPEKIVVADISIWDGFISSKNYLYNEWATINYKFTEYSLPITYRDFPLVPGIDSIDEYEINTTDSGNEMIRINIMQHLGLEKYRFFYRYFYRYLDKKGATLPKLYGWEKFEVRYDIIDKIPPRGQQCFFIKNNQLISCNSRSSDVFEILYYTPEEKERIIRFVKAESQKKAIKQTAEEKKLMKIETDKAQKEKEAVYQKSLKSKTIKDDGE